MKVVFDAERLRNPNSGLGQFCRSLGRALMVERPSDSDITFIVPPSDVGIFGAEARHAPTGWWQRFVSSEEADVWHAAHQDVWIKPPAGTPVVLSIMDLNFLERTEYSEAKKARRLAAVQRKVDRAAAIATISEFTAEVVRRNLRIPDIPLRAIHLGNPIDDPTAPAHLPADPRIASLKPGSFFLFIGVLHPKKNVHTLIPMMREFPEMTLVLAGPDDNPYAAELRRAASDAGLDGRVIIPGAVDESTRRWLYANSRALLFPSLSEGFGLPVVEAMSFGKPVFLSRLTSLPEIGGALASYFDSFDPGSMARTVRDGLAAYDTDPARGAALKAHAAQYSWSRAAKEYWALYSEALRSRRR